MIIVFRISNIYIFSEELKNKKIKIPTDISSTGILDQLKKLSIEKLC